MGRPTVVLDLATHTLALAAGGVFVPGCTLAVLEEVELVIRAGDDELHCAARVVWRDANGAGLELVDRTPEIKAQLAALASGGGLGATARGSSTTQSGSAARDSTDDIATATFDRADAHTTDDLATATFARADAARNTGSDGETTGDAGDPGGDAGDADTDATDDPDPEVRRVARNIHERLRGLTLAQQIKTAQHGEISERMVLERIYGKTVWEPLLRNPRLTAPEVARIARMGALPRPLVEQICSNGTWLQIPEVRRALLGNPRLGTDQIVRVLRLLPKHELKLAATTTGYPHAVRASAKRLLKELEDG